MKKMRLLSSALDGVPAGDAQQNLIVSIDGEIFQGRAALGGDERCDNFGNVEIVVTAEQISNAV